MSPAKAVPTVKWNCVFLCPARAHVKQVLAKMLPIHQGRKWKLLALFGMCFKKLLSAHFQVLVKSAACESLSERECPGDTPAVTAHTPFTCPQHGGFLSDVVHICNRGFCYGQ